jgi:malonyl CoA-acyl carrier protein transacylase
MYEDMGSAAIGYDDLQMSLLDKQAERYKEMRIEQNLIDQLTGPVRWTQTIEAMIADGASSFTEVGPGKVLQGLIGKINKEIPVESFN